MLFRSGMPGCGKSAVGCVLAEALGRELLDTDAVITERTGLSPAQIIERQGETAFRDIESQAVADCGRRTGCVIATGGGAVLRSENIAALRQNGVIFFRDRDLEDIKPSDSRPLSRDREALHRRYEERYDIYCATADHIIRHTSTVAEAGAAILEVFHEISDIKRP